MAEMTISLRIDPATGKKNIIVSLHGDEDALPHEHEQMHKSLVEKLLHGGLLKPTEVGQIVVEREEKQKGPALPSGTQPQDQRTPQKQGG
jgi:FtsH ternary system domain X3-analog